MSTLWSICSRCKCSRKQHAYMSRGLLIIQVSFSTTDPLKELASSKQVWSNPTAICRCSEPSQPHCSLSVSQSVGALSPVSHTAVCQSVSQSVGALSPVRYTAICQSVSQSVGALSPVSHTAVCQSVSQSVSWCSQPSQIYCSLSVSQSVGALSPVNHTAVCQSVSQSVL